MIKIGILNGYVESPEDEKQCNKYVWTSSTENYWSDNLKNIKDNGENKFCIDKIMASEISNKYAVILNPFGEVYPEYSYQKRPVYGSIKNYMLNGGVFINTAGFPFFYAWDVKEGTSKPISDEKIIMTSHVDSPTFSQTQLNTLIRFSGTLFYQDFGASTTYDTIKWSGAITLEPFQTQDDQQYFGNLINNISEITEFRAIIKGVKNCIPLVRANREEFGEVYPISALKYGNGYLLIAAMGMTGEKECSLFFKAIVAFCDWLKDKYII